jgi:hypothetical protein
LILIDLGLAKGIVNLSFEKRILKDVYHRITSGHHQCICIASREGIAPTGSSIRCNTPSVAFEAGISEAVDQMTLIRVLMASVQVEESRFLQGLNIGQGVLSPQESLANESLSSLVHCELREERILTYSVLF